MAGNSRLTFGNGGVPRGWGFPSPLYNFETHEYVVGPMIWHGRKPATPADIKRLRGYFHDGIRIDRPSLRGKNDPKYSTFRSRQLKRKKSPYKQIVILGG